MSRLRIAAAQLDLVVGDLAGNVDRETASNAATNKHDFIVSLEQAEKRRRNEDAVAADAEARKLSPGQPGAGVRLLAQSNSNLKKGTP